MSRVLSLSLADKLYARVSKQADSLGLTVYQYVRRSIEVTVEEDEAMTQMAKEWDTDELDE